MDKTLSRESILEAKEKLGDRNAEIISDVLHLEKYNPQRRIGCCPNPNHRDSTPSFSYNPKSHSFFCFGCHINVDVIDAWMSTGMTFIQAAEKLYTEAEIPHNFSYIGAKTDQAYYYPEPEYADNKESVYKYWALRGISRETIDALDIQQDRNGNTLFQYYDDADVLRCVKVRPSRAVKHGELKCWWLSDKERKPYSTMHLLFNMNRVNISQPLIICTGEGDCATAVECGFTNATSIPMGDGNLQFIQQCWDFLNQFNEIILVHDNDEAGRKFIKEAVRRLGEHRTKVVDVPETWTLENGNVVKIKDLNELLYRGGSEAVIKAINSAKEREIETVVDYTKVSDFSMEDVDGIITGFRDLDSSLGKLYVGTTNIITGISGSGKSSFISTLVDMAIEQGFPCWIYSGELNNQLLKSWIDFVHAGQFNIESVKRNGFTSYKIKKEAQENINRFYANQLFFYKDTEDCKVSRLLESIEASVKRYGVKMAVIDNMTSVDLECNESNRWEKQDAFVRQCIELARKLNIILFLVLHPKKMDIVRPVDLFDLAGVTSSANLSHRILSLYRVQDSDRQPDRKGNQKPFTNCDVQLRVVKDRFASATGKIFPLWYDVPSRRFYDSMETLRRDYEWDTVKHDGMLPFFNANRFNADDDSEVFGEA